MLRTGADELLGFSTRIKDAGIAIRHSRERILFYTAGSRDGLNGVVGHGPGHKKKLYRRKIHFFVIEKSVEDVKQGQKVVPDLVESMMKVLGLVKEALRRISMKRGHDNLDPKSQTSEFALFRCPEKWWTRPMWQARQ